MIVKIKKLKKSTWLRNLSKFLSRENSTDEEKQRSIEEFTLQHPCYIPTMYEKLPKIVKDKIFPACEKLQEKLGQLRRLTRVQKIVHSAGAMAISLYLYSALGNHFRYITVRNDEYVPDYCEKAPLVIYLGRNFPPDISLGVKTMDETGEMSAYGRKLGVLLYTFLIDAKILEEATESELIKLFGLKKRKKKGKKGRHYCVPLFDLGKLQFRPACPMICPPKRWIFRDEMALPQREVRPQPFGTMERGGYLTGDLLRNSYIFNSKNIKNFFLETSKEHVLLINEINSVKFTYDKKLVAKISSDKKFCQRAGVITDESFAFLRIREQVKRFKEEKKRGHDYSLHLFKTPSTSLREFVKSLQKNKSNALRDYYNVENCTLFQDFPAYFPTISDFRGRQIRLGSLNPQGDSLSKAMIQFDKKTHVLGNLMDRYYIYGAKFFCKFDSDEKALSWFKENYRNVLNLQEGLFKNAEQPPQALALALELGEEQKVWGKPFFTRMTFSLDAHASAYQLYSVLSLDKSCAKDCRIIRGADDHIMPDLYNTVKTLLLKGLESDKDFNRALLPYIDRSLTKNLTMPFFYGITYHGMRDAIYKHADNNSTHFSEKEISIVTKTVREILKNNYANLIFLYDFLKILGFFTATFGRPLIIGLREIFTTSQFYEKIITERLECPLFFTGKKSIPIPLPEEGGHENAFGTVEEKEKKSKKKSRDKRKSISLAIGTGKADPIKSRNATPANVIHHIDALVAFSVLKTFYKECKSPFIYSNHDCFYTTIDHVDKLIDIYNKSVLQVLGENPPLIVKKLFHQNVIPVFLKTMPPEEVADLIKEIESPTPPPLRKLKLTERMSSHSERMIKSTTKLIKYYQKFLGNSLHGVAPGERREFIKDLLNAPHSLS